MECDWVAYRNELKRDTFKDFIEGYRACFEFKEKP
jgi:hypothetical protein